jgi:hypothetical protein
MSKRHRKPEIPIPDDHPIEVASRSDRKYFEEHPEETSYIRAMVPGEFPHSPEDAAPAHVLVEQIRPGFRIRRGIHLFKTEQVRPFEDIPATIDGFRLMGADE